MPFDPDTFDPFQPFVEEYLEDWTGWAERHDHDEKIGRVMGIMASLHEKYHAPFQITQAGGVVTGAKKVNFWPGPADWCWLPHQIEQGVRRSTRSHWGPDFHLRDQAMVWGSYSSSFRSLGACPGYLPSGLPDLQIEPGLTVFVAPQSQGSQGKGVGAFVGTVKRVKKEDDICPICDREYLRYLAMGTSYATTIADYEKKRILHSAEHAKSYCEVKPGAWVVEHEVGSGITLFDENGFSFAGDEADKVWALMREACARTPGLVLVPLPVAKSYKGEVSLDRVLPFEFVAFLRARHLLGVESDADVLDACPLPGRYDKKIGLGTIQRWRKALQIAAPRKRKKE